MAGTDHQLSYVESEVKNNCMEIRIYNNTSSLVESAVRITWHGELENEEDLDLGDL